MHRGIVDGIGIRPVRALRDRVRVIREPPVDPDPFPTHREQAPAAIRCLLGIEDLHFHDLRHEATSRLFEAGYSIPEVAQFTLHRSWKDLQRYANLRPAKLQLRAPV